MSRRWRWHSDDPLMLDVDRDGADIDRDGADVNRDGGDVDRDGADKCADSFRGDADG
jgi:hypothetical protein